ncbi:uncharacterized protein LOC119418750 [Nematolebias whitei]|uniref:uncharacterized protein LOC119418750 n=1 Tax=Nematolebias whitei TaxID=451745 RepID=UPI0018977FE2|nr:uncharacterized protein LOC119418750 [Nematolebias whitei]
MEAPTKPVLYTSQQILNCTFDEEGVIPGSSGWNLSRQFERFEINNGLSAQIIHTSTYECGFTVGSVRHTARSYLDVALLPDVINMKFDPLIADCSDATTTSFTVSVSASIPKTTEIYNITWSENNIDKLQQKTRNDSFTYSYATNIICKTDKGTRNNFLNGLGATQEVAKDIFEGIKNSSILNAASEDETADIGASIGIISVMANASKIIILKEDVFPDLIEGASNMVNSNWSGVTDTIRHQMSELYLNSVESLVKHIEGLFILITGCLAEQKVRDELFRIIMVKVGRETDSMQKLTSTTYTKDK